MIVENWRTTIELMEGIQKLENMIVLRNENTKML